MKHESDKPRPQKPEPAVPEEEQEKGEFSLDERVKFRVCKKLAKVLFLAGGRKGSLRE